MDWRRQAGESPLPFKTPLTPSPAHIPLTLPTLRKSSSTAWLPAWGGQVGLDEQRCEGNSRGKENFPGSRVRGSAGKRRGDLKHQDCFQPLLIGSAVHSDEGKTGDGWDSDERKAGDGWDSDEGKAGDGWDSDEGKAGDVWVSCYATGTCMGSKVHPTETMHGPNTCQSHQLLPLMDLNHIRKKIMMNTTPWRRP